MMTAPSTLPPPFMKEGTLIADRYVLNAPIGQGGMGSVWRAMDQVLAAPIALKVVAPSHDDATHVKRFLREARLSASVQHPNVVRVTDFGTHEGAPFIAMELLEGVSLARRLEQLPRLSVDESIQIVGAILRGLAAAHDADVVHRDIKPDNVFLVEGPDGMYPKLLDFGISMGTWGGKRVSAVTTEGRVFGTPDYMSPEQARGMEDIDHRADIWGAGVLLYEMLCHRTPFLEELPGDLLVAIVRDQPPEPSDLEPDLGLALSGVIMKALEKEPDDRWGSAREFRDAIFAASPIPQFIPDVTGPIPIHRGPTLELDPAREARSNRETLSKLGSEDVTGEELAIPGRSSSARRIGVLVLLLLVGAGIAWTVWGRDSEPVAVESEREATTVEPVEIEAPLPSAPLEAPSPTVAEVPIATTGAEVETPQGNVQQPPETQPPATQPPEIQPPETQPPETQPDPAPARTQGAMATMRTATPVMESAMLTHRAFRELDY